MASEKVEAVPGAESIAAAARPGPIAAVNQLAVSGLIKSASAISGVEKQYTAGVEKPRKLHRSASTPCKSFKSSFQLQAIPNDSNFGLGPTSNAPRLPTDQHGASTPFPPLPVDPLASLEEPLPTLPDVPFAYEAGPSVSSPPASPDGDNDSNRSSSSGFGSASSSLPGTPSAHKLSKTNTPTDQHLCQEKRENVRRKKPSDMAQWGCVERPLSNFFFNYGKLVSRHPWPFILLPVFLTGALSVGFLYRTLVLDATFLYTPVDARSRYERQVIHERWPLKDGSYQPGKAVTDLRQCQVTVAASDGGNILRGRFATAVEQLNHFIMNDIIVIMNRNSYSYQDLCIKDYKGRCFDNPTVNLVNAMYEHYPANFTWPSVQIGFQRTYLASTLGGVRLRNITAYEGNVSRKAYDVVGSAQAWLLIYHLKFQPQNMSEISGVWERAFEEAMRNYHSEYLRLTYFHSQTLSKELHKNADALVPKFTITFLILIAFSVLCSMVLIPRTCYVDWTLSRPWLALLGVVNAGMGVVSAIGLLAFAGMLFADIVAVMPFLVISIGVDNMFLMIAAWRRTNRALPVELRLAETLSDSAISISITAITDALSFGVGAITTIPAVQLFCAYTCVAVMMTFVYQLTFFVGLMALFGRLERAGGHCLWVTNVKDAEDEEKHGALSRMFLMGTLPDRDPKNVERNFTRSYMNEFFEHWFAPILMNPVVKGLVVFWLLAYLGFAVWGCTQLREGLKPVNLLIRDSYAVPHYEALEKYFWPYGVEVQVVVNNASDLATATGRREAFEIIDAFSNTKHTLGESGVMFWLWSYMSYVQRFEYDTVIAQRPQMFHRILKQDYLSFNSHALWRNDIVFTEPLDPDQTPTVSAYRFTVGMKNFQTTNQQRETMSLLRDVAERFPQRNITTFMFFWLFGDQYSVILPNTVQNIGIALICMVVISLLLIPQPLCALWVALAIVFIDVGVIGYMTLWGVNLDVISMITIIMSIGFSVDFSAHISYGYVISDQLTPALRVYQALGALGWPILQGAMSTVFGVIALATVESYLVVTFFKTVLLVIVLGMLHGLVFLPVLLSIFVRGSCCVKGSRKDVVAPEDSPTPLTVSGSLASLPAAAAAAMPEKAVLAEGVVKRPKMVDTVTSPFGHLGHHGHYDHRYGVYLPRLSHTAEDEPPAPWLHAPGSAAAFHASHRAHESPNGVPLGHPAANGARHVATLTPSRSASLLQDMQHDPGIFHIANGGGTVHRVPPLNADVYLTAPDGTLRRGVASNGEVYLTNGMQGRLANGELLLADSGTLHRRPSPYHVTLYHHTDPTSTPNPGPPAHHRTFSHSKDQHRQTSDQFFTPKR